MSRSAKASRESRKTSRNVFGLKSDQTHFDSFLLLMEQEIAELEEQ